MSNPSFTADSVFKQRDAESYDKLADDFDLLTARYTAPIADRIVAMAGIAAGDRVLDVGCGTGVLTLLAAREVGGSGRVVGIDLSVGMLAKAAVIAASSGLAERIEWARGDAEQLQFADASFNAVVSLYALRHFPNPDKALREMFRCCAVGGRVLVAIGSAPPLLSMAALRAAFRRVGELGLRLVDRAPLQAPAHLDHLIESRLGHANAVEHAAWTHGINSFNQSLAAQLSGAGFSGVRVAWLGHSSVIDSVEEFWTLQFTLSSLARKRMQAIAPEQVAAIRAEFNRQCTQQLARGGRLVYRSGALVATAVRPG